MKTKTIKTPLMMAAAYGPTYCSSAHALKSKLLRRSEAQYGLVPRLSHHEWQKHRLFKPEKQESIHNGQLTINSSSDSLSLEEAAKPSEQLKIES